MKCAPAYHARGEAHGNAKLTWVAVRAIRASYVPRHPDYGMAALAAHYGVDPNTINRVISGKSWREVGS